MTEKLSPFQIMDFIGLVNESKATFHIEEQASNKSVLVLSCNDDPFLLLQANVSSSEYDARVKTSFHLGQGEFLPVFYDILKNLRQTMPDGSEVGNDVAILSKNFQSAKDEYVLDIITMRGS